MSDRARTAQDVQDLVREGHGRILPRSGGTKSALSRAPDGVSTLDVSELRGIVSYDPSEYTFTAFPSTPLSEVEACLRESGQYLPFDPPFAGRGATLGGTVAAGLSGPERFRYGGVRDFLIGVQFVDGVGRLVHGGGRVVKNAAGFDFPKLLVGSLGRLGILVEVTFKVFPRSEAHSTLRFSVGDASAASAMVRRLASSLLDLEALDYEPHTSSNGGYVVLRVGGVEAGLKGRIQRVERFLDREADRWDDDESYWRSVRDFDWMGDGAWLLKVPLTPTRLVGLDARLGELGAVRRYSAGSQVGWIVVRDAASVLRLGTVLDELNLRGLLLDVPADQDPVSFRDLFRGARSGAGPLAERVRHALDPNKKFAEF